MTEECAQRLLNLLRRRFPRREDVVSETLARMLWKAFNGVDWQECPEGYAVATAKLVKKEIDRKDSRYAPIIHDPPALAREDDLPRIPLEVLRRLMKEALHSTEREFCRQYFKEVRNVDAHRASLAKKLNVTMDALYKRASRIKAKLTAAYEAERLHNRS